MKKVSIYVKLIFIFIAFLAIAYFTKGQSKSDFIDKTLNISSFIFGIIIAFSIANRHSRLSSIRQRLREQDSAILDMYFLSKSFGNRVVSSIRKKIDNMLIPQLDYNLTDFGTGTLEKSKDMYMFIERIGTKSGMQQEIKKKMLYDMNDVLRIQKDVSYQVKNKMMIYEWVSLLSLAGIIIFSLFYINANTVSSILIISLLSTSLILLFLILGELDSLQWQEQNWIWEPVSKLFVDLNLKPYFPVDVFTDNRFDIRNIEGVREIRIATYPNKYPDMSGKRVKIVKIKSR